MRECEICYTNMISGKGSTDNETFVFNCGHRFCTSCTRNHLSGLINVKKLDQLFCPEQGCGCKVADD